MWTPVGIPTWILYFIPLIFARSDASRHYPLILAGACSVLIFVAFWLSPQDSTGTSTLIHRTLVVIAIWVTAVLIDKPSEEPSE
jgi:hypothetical protein